LALEVDLGVEYDNNEINKNLRDFTHYFWPYSCLEDLLYQISIEVPSATG
jgi:hypothetical protein